MTAGEPPGGGGGDGGGSPKDREGSGSGEVNQGSSTKTTQLLTEYTLGKILGQGAFGIVHACTHKATGQQFAVKMIDKVDTPAEELEREPAMMKLLAHPTVARLHAVYNEKTFVCLVMDFYKGGDLIEGMQAHWKDKGQIPCDKVIPIARQMVDGVAWLHSQNVVHRDIKCDNYLMNVNDILRTDCRIFLSDFGTVTVLQPGESLRHTCGTKLYWAPEFYDQSYGHKVDIWAVGVIMYGLASGKFPFRGESDAKTKALKFKSSVPAVCQEFILALLCRDVQQRPSGAKALEHAWLSTADSGSKPYVEVPYDKEEFKPDVRDTGANAAVADRRIDMVERLLEQAAANDAKRTPTNKGLPDGLGAASFDVDYRFKQKAVRFEWWPNEKATKEGVVGSYESTKMLDDKKESGLQVVSQLLLAHQISTEGFGRGQAKSIETFVEEVQCGEARLMLDATQHKKMVRVVDVVLLRLARQVHGRLKYLIVRSETYADGRERGDMFILPGGKKEPHENTIKAVERIIQELDMGDCNIVADYEGRERFEEQADSPSYPGVKTVYRKTIVHGDVKTNDPRILERIGAGGSQMEMRREDNSVRSYVWLDDKECKAKLVMLRAPLEGQEVSALVHAPVQLEEDDLVKYLDSFGISKASFGDSFDNFYSELVKGESSLLRQPDGSLLRIVDLVVLLLTKSGTGEVLVQASESKTSEGGRRDTKALKNLPGLKRRPDENHFLVAQRVLGQVLKVDENMVNLNHTDVCLLEEFSSSKAYAGIRTLYRKRIIKAETWPEASLKKMFPKSLGRGAAE